MKNGTSSTPSAAMRNPNHRVCKHVPSPLVRKADDQVDAHGQGEPLAVRMDSTIRSRWTCFLIISSVRCEPLSGA